MKKAAKTDPKTGTENTPVDPKLPVASQILDVPPTLASDLSDLDKDLAELNRQIEVIKQRKQDIIYGFLGAHNIAKGTPFGIPPTHDKISIFTKEELARAQQAAMQVPATEPAKEDVPAKEEKPAGNKGKVKSIDTDTTK